MENVLSLRRSDSLPLLTDFFVAGRQASGKEGSGWSGFPDQGTQWL